MSSSFHRILHHTTRWALALVFVTAGTSKLMDISAFAEAVGDFGVVHDSLVFPAAWAIVLVEIFAGLALAWNVRASLAFVLCLLAVFLGVLTYGIWLGLDIDCGCFGNGYHVTLTTQLLIDMGLIFLAGIVHWSRKKCRGKAIDPVAVRSSTDRRHEPKTQELLSDASNGTLRCWPLSSSWVAARTSFSKSCRPKSPRSS